MQPRNRQELYRSFIEFVIADLQSERKLVNRRMFNVLLWCFIAPAILMATGLILIRLGVIPPAVRSGLDSLMVLCPVAYGFYILGSEVLTEMPSAFKRGGIANTLSSSLKDSEWRDRKCETLKRNLEASALEWDWIIFSFGIDLEQLRNRNRYMTGLAGAVLFMILQGIDLLGDEEVKTTWIKSPFGMMEAAPADFSQFIALGLVLLLLYLSGNQTHQSLARYRNCAELIRKQL
jgi:hypothetical protein